MCTLGNYKDLSPTSQFSTTVTCAVVVLSGLSGPTTEGSKSLKKGAAKPFEVFRTVYQWT
jgi:hypothetical protein